jgi:hypothetical protein
MDDGIEEIKKRHPPTRTSSTPEYVTFVGNTTYKCDEPVFFFFFFRFMGNIFINTGLLPVLTNAG